MITDLTGGASVMASKRTVCVILTLILSLWECLADEDFVNPSDPLNFDPVHIRMNNKVENDIVSSPEQTDADAMKNGFPVHTERDEGFHKDEWNVKTENHCPSLKDETLKSIFKRYLMSLVQRVESRVDSSDVPVEFCMKIRTSHSDLMLLRLYGMDGTGSAHAVHEKLEKMMLYTTELPNESPVFWLESKIGLSRNYLLMVIAILLLGIIAARMLSCVQITRTLITKGILFAFIISCAFSYVELYQQKVADQDKILSEDITKRCPNLSKDVWARFTGYFSSAFTFQDENCREYYEAAVVNPFFKVTLFEAGAIAITKTVVAPFKIIGKGIKELMVGLFKDLPAQYASSLFIAMLVFLILSPFLICRYTVKIPFLLTLHPPSALERYLPPKETKLALCSNCSHNKDQIQMEKVEGKESVHLTAPYSTAIASSLPPHDIDRYNCKSRAIESDNGGAGDCKQIVKECEGIQDQSHVPEIVMKLKSCEVSCVLSESDASSDVEQKMNKLEINDDKGCNLRSDGEVTDSNDGVSNVAYVPNGNTSNFFLDEEVRSSDSLSEIGSDWLLLENSSPDDVENTTQDCLNKLKCEMEAR